MVLAFFHALKTSPSRPRSFASSRVDGSTACKATAGRGWMPRRVDSTRAYARAVARILETSHITIEASAEIVWTTLTDFASHARWDSYVVAWEGEAKVGARMRLVAMADERREFDPIVTEV